MRATVGYALRHPSALPSWWADFPGRHAWWWKVHLLGEGAGWLRWKEAVVDADGGWYDPPEQTVIAPPLRRLFWAIRWHDWSGAMSLKTVWDRDF